MLGRLLAAVSYIGLTAALTPLAQPDTPFVVRHARQALIVHLLRVALIAPVLAGQLVGLDGPIAEDALARFAAKISLLTLLGLVPWHDLTTHGLWIPFVLTITWALDIFGSFLALTGYTTDWHAFFHAGWPHEDQRAVRSARDRNKVRGAEEKEQIQRLREGRLARVRAADSVATHERRRHASLDTWREEYATLMARRTHLTQLLELGEISERRYQQQQDTLASQLAALRTRIAMHDARQLPGSAIAERHDPPTEAPIPAPLQTLAIAARSGVPLLTYGNFRLDEALVTGILSAFNSLSEEVFGAQVHKTQLAEGQVLSFIHARWTVTMAVFTDDPSPAQLRMLRDLVQEFEALNSAELSRPAPDPARLHQVQIPFTFASPATSV